MAVLQTIRNFFGPPAPAEESEFIAPAAAATVYEIRPLVEQHQREVMQLNLRCFRDGENYTKHTFSFLLTEPNVLSYRVVTADGEMVGFVFVMLAESGAGHITTIGVAPEHRRRRLAGRLLAHAEGALRSRGVGTVMLEVRVSNVAAQSLYRNFGYSAVQRIGRYYNNGEDCFLMMKSLD